MTEVLNYLGNQVTGLAATKVINEIPRDDPTSVSYHRRFDLFRIIGGRLM